MNGGWMLKQRGIFFLLFTKQFNLTVMFPELPTCSPFANKIPRFKLNALPSSSESVYSEITASTAQRATEEILDVFSAHTLCLCISVTMHFSLCKKETLLLQEVTFSHIMSQIPFLGYMMPHAKQEARREQRGSCLSRGQTILTF